MPPIKANLLRRTSTLRRRLVVTALMTGLLATLAGPALATPPSVRDFGPAIDGYARYEGQTGCSGEQPGAQEFRALLQKAYGANGAGITRSCSSGGKSEHKEGRAYDWMLNAGSSSDRAKADELLNWLLKTDEHGNKHAMARRFGIMYVIWNRKVWNAYRPEAGWTAYSGYSPHTDHIHFSFSRAGAAKQTSFWTAPPAGEARVAAAPGPFEDVGSRHRFVREITWAADSEITTGFRDDTFRPGESVTRAQMVAFLWRMMDAPEATEHHGFNDVPADAHYRVALNWAVQVGIVGGNADNKFAPDDALSRSQMARMLFTLVGEPDGAPAHPFVDVRERDDAAVSWLRHREITEGMTADRFAGHFPVNRQQTAAFLYRLAGNEAAWGEAEMTPSSVRFD
ncbi:MAG TPA: S-layer homology domain-containing protein [Egicoccus sp.]|nr:S-layer homology domain-containing protein [Egicoccus sp.]HSK24968.1 S-layer homology domain-containing protein [Egicoccus sp.]